MKTDLKLYDLLKIDEKQLSNYKLHLARFNGIDQPLDIFVQDFNEWVTWNTYRDGDDDFKREYIFSLIQDYHYSSKDRYIFGGVFRITKRYDNWKETKKGYDVEVVEEFAPYIGRLEVNFRGPKRGRAFYFEKYIGDMTINQIREKAYQCIEFPGYDNVCLDFTTLEHIVRNQVQTWKVALENMKGIYVIVDKSNGKKYVGSAYGETGIWSRWSTYVYSDGHGNNDELVDLIAKNGTDYARKNFQLAIIEVLSMKTDDDTVIHRESFWKNVLQTRGAFGYNKN